jgi:hypothetical protein
MSKHFGAECERMRQRVQKLLTEQSDEPAQKPTVRPARRQQQRQQQRTTGANLLGKLNHLSPLTALVCGAALASLLTWAAMSFGGQSSPPRTVDSPAATAQSPR